MDGEAPPIIPAPPLIAEPTAPAKGPWGFWPTIGWTLIIGAVWVGVQIGVAAIYVVGMMIAKHGKEIATQGLETDGTMLSIAEISCAPAAVAITFLFIRIRKGPSLWEYLGPRRPNWNEVALWPLGLLALATATDFLFALLGRPIVPDFMLNVYRNTSFLPLLWIAIVLVAPVCEEIVFRGFIFKGMVESRSGAVGAILISATWWSVIHLQYDVTGIVFIFVCGIWIGLARLKSESITLCIIMHALLNLVAMVQTALYVRSN